ncbi:hypothetical protein ACQ4M4_17010 [Leptolyngbya sp. AN02str]|uniref:hypothetical protein n=1 Tax=Leptolyngbya sp. AN02str TaxID=3423363 RepID=UPI003D319EA6
MVQRDMQGVAGEQNSQSSWRSRLPIRELSAAAAIAGCLGLLVVLQLPQLRQLQVRSQTATEAEIEQDLTIQRARLNVLRSLPSFGFQNLIANWTFLNFLQYFGDKELRQRTDYSLSPEFFDIVLSRDPRFWQAYQFVSTSTSMYAGQPERAVGIMNQSLQYVTPEAPPQAFYAWRIKGIDELLFLGDIPAAQQSFETAAAWAEASSLPEAASVADFSRQTAAFLANNPDSRFAQFSAWFMVLQTAPDDETRAIAVQRIESLGGAIVQNEDGTYQAIPPSSD